MPCLLRDYAHPYLCTALLPGSPVHCAVRAQRKRVIVSEHLREDVSGVLRGVSNTQGHGTQGLRPVILLQEPPRYGPNQCGLPLAGAWSLTTLGGGLSLGPFPLIRGATLR